MSSTEDNWWQLNPLIMMMMIGGDGCDYDEDGSLPQHSSTWCHWVQSPQTVFPRGPRKRPRSASRSRWPPVCQSSCPPILGTPLRLSEVLRFFCTYWFFNFFQLNRFYILLNVKYVKHHYYRKLSLILVMALSTMSDTITNTTGQFYHKRIVSTLSMVIIIDKFIRTNDLAVAGKYITYLQWP